MRPPPEVQAAFAQVIMRRYECASTILTSNRPVDDWGKLLGDTAAVTALLDRLLHHARVLTCGPRSWRTKLQPAPDSRVATSRQPSPSGPVWWPVLRCRSVAGFEVSTEDIGNASNAETSALLLQHVLDIQEFVDHPDAGFLALGFGPRPD